ncbi:MULTISPECIES: serine hydrolase [unclassified Streptomyces]|uniref:serine hydrolase domain-containing protein n=1 Tax=unclassified Streptomyces TaxID=2593676 RepID=UPI00088A2B45|nr:MULTISPECIES: serine hydrolase domain-containing protein [unclassified Streptomyces]PBC80628.1 CubicO group peptidase (beta-lactamase class C family) [Streptomyces sp. 2321.6]SDR57865.1 CubicO group peptidase, beta-lactamase class C family [Streptomyces sp. KS_16]SEB82170.1 CubicO group peptidase, beta-lactamase class C family [Streptomyces sp. 2133.1]SEF13721.1 CubicO group peptidase, beta-lactamase class C family [Streptomyces sp. 2112.3]SNC61360.1 CubicO group peptidase, beta-lactamase c
MPHASSAQVASRQPTHIRRLLQERLDTLARTHQVPGAQLAVQVDSVTYTVQTGEADVTTGEMFTADTAVPLGSVTKPYTAAVVQLLADDGDLELTDLVGTHVPELRRAPHLTVRQLLSHTGGLPTGPDSDDAAALTPARYLSAHCSGRDTVCAPGSGFSYSNAGYVAAGRLIETVTGMPWQEAVRALLLEPLGTVPAFLGDRAPARPVARGHSVNPTSGRVLAVQQNLAPVEAPAGALLASALDLVALGRALIGHGPRTVLTPDAAEEMRRPVPGAAPGVLADAWGLGLALFQQGAQQWCGHDGNAQGTSCHLRAEPDSGTVVAFTSNANNGTALWHELAEDLDRITGVQVPSATRPPERGRAVALPQCAGTYHNGTVEYRIAADSDGSLTLTVNGDTPAPLVCYPDLTCDLVDPASGRRHPGGRFVRDPESGAIDRVQISGRTARRTVTA